MGDVVNIRRSTDDDLLAEFSKACPAIPIDVDTSVLNAAERALGTSRSRRDNGSPSFKRGFLLVAGVAIVSIAVARGFAWRWDAAVDSASRNEVATFTEFSQDTAPASTEASPALEPGQSSEPKIAAARNTSAQDPLADRQSSWQRSRGAWAEYIARLERDPFYQHVLEEKRKFAEQYPD